MGLTKFLNLSIEKFFQKVGWMSSKSTFNWNHFSEILVKSSWYFIFSNDGPYVTMRRHHLYLLILNETFFDFLIKWTTWCLIWSLFVVKKASNRPLECQLREVTEYEMIINFQDQWSIIHFWKRYLIGVNSLVNAIFI